MLEAHALHHIGQFDIDTQIVGIELELIAVEKAAILIDIHVEIGDVAIILDPPMAVVRRIGPEVDDVGHDILPHALCCVLSPEPGGVNHILHHNANILAKVNALYAL